MIALNRQALKDVIPGILQSPHGLIIVDSTILSNTWHKGSSLPTTLWWRSVSRERLVVPRATLDVIDRGISLLRDKDPEHARDLQAWRTDLVESGIQVLYDDIAIHSALSAICSLKPLKGLWCVGSRRSTIFEEIYVTATASTFDAPVATLKVRRYLEIAEYYTMPGLLVPAGSPWRIPGKKRPFNRNRLMGGPTETTTRARKEGRNEQ